MYICIYQAKVSTVVAGCWPKVINHYVLHAQLRMRRVRCLKATSRNDNNNNNRINNTKHINDNIYISNHNTTTSTTTSSTTINNSNNHKHNNNDNKFLSAIADVAGHRAHLSSGDRDSSRLIHIYIYIYIYICLIIYMIDIERDGDKSEQHAPHPPTNMVDFRGFDSSTISILRGGILMSIGNLPESLSPAMLVGMMLVGRLGRRLGIQFRLKFCVQARATSPIVSVSKQDKVPDTSCMKRIYRDKHIYIYIYI